MTCGYCRYLNSDEERRCHRCGRPLRDAYATAVAGALAREPRPSPSEAAPARTNFQPLRQPMLFPDGPTGKVVGFDGLSAPPKPRIVTRTSTRMTTKRAAKPNDAQPSLDFLQPAPPAPRKLGTTVDAVIDCDATVAAPMHRVCAAAIDAVWVLIACSLFFITFTAMGGAFRATKPVMLVMAGAGVIIAMFYGFVWVCAGGRTPGMRALQLRLVHFDGFPANGNSRWLRYAGACLGYCAGGLGLLWALLDEESLAWHDHISRTFPTFIGPESSFGGRR